MIYNRNPNVRTVLLSLMKSITNLQFFTGMYGLLAYLCSYICKKERKRYEIMGKVVKESPGLNVREKLRKLGNVPLTNVRFLLMKPSIELCPYQ